MNREQKEQLVAALKKDFSESNLLVVTHYLGLDVKEINELRNKMRDSNVKFKVTKNKLTKLALPGSPFENVAELFSGPTAVAYSKDSILAAKVAVNFSKKNEKLKIIGGSFEGKLIDKEKINFLASLPSLDEIRSRLISLIMAPSTKIASTLQAPASQILRLITTQAKKG